MTPARIRRRKQQLAHSRVMLAAAAIAVFVITLVSPIQGPDPASLVIGIVFQAALFAALGALAYWSAPSRSRGRTGAMIGAFVMLAVGFELLQSWLSAGAGDFLGVAAATIGAVVGLSIAVSSDREKMLQQPKDRGTDEDLMGDWWRWGAED